MWNPFNWFSSPKDDLSPDSKLTVGQFLSRKELTGACCTESGWVDCCLTAYPKHFKQHRVLQSLVIVGLNARDLNDPFVAVPTKKQWTKAKRFKSCCKHLERQAMQMIGQRFTEELDAEDLIIISVEPNENSSCLRYVFRNQIANAGVAFHVLHLLSHLRCVAFDEVYIFTDDASPVSPFSVMNPVVAELLLPLHTGELQLIYPSGDINLFGLPVLPALNRISADCKMEELVWVTFAEPMMSLQLVCILAQHAINKSCGGDAYKQLTIRFCKKVSVEKCQEYIQTVIKLFAIWMNLAEGANDFVPRVKLDFDKLSMRWPLPLFKRWTPIDKKLTSTYRMAKRVDYTFAFKETIEQGELNFQVIAHTVRLLCLKSLEGVTLDFAPKERQ